jgi:hypothetical protein
MSLGTLGSTLNDELNRLANGGTYRDMDDMVDEALAAKQWANRENISPYSTDTVGVLNEIAGLGLDKRNWLDFNGVCNYIAGTSGLPAAAALRQIYPTTDLLTGVASYYVDAVDAQLGGGYLYLPGVSSNYASAPDSSALDITGDIDLRCKVALDAWVPAAFTVLIAKLGASGNRSYRLAVNMDGTINAYCTSDGNTTIEANSTVVPTIANGAIKWIRAVIDVNNGASGRDFIFYTSDDGITWTQLGTTVTQAGTISIFNSTTALEIGSQVSGSAPAKGKFYRAQVLNGIGGTVVFDANFETAMTAQTVTSFTESSTNAATVTINRTTYNFQLDTLPNLGTAGSLLPTTVGSSLAADSNDPKFLDHTGTNYVYAPGVNSNYLSIPDANDLDITGDLDIRVQVAPDSWTPAATQILASKFGVSGQRSWWFAIDALGAPQFVWSADGINFTTKTSASYFSYPAGSIKWLRVTFDVDNGASGNDVKFFTSDDGTTWTQWGSTITTAVVATIFVSTAPVEIASRTVGGNTLAAKIYRAQILNGIDGTTVLDVDTSVITSGADNYVVPTTYTGQAGAFFTGTGLSLNGVAGNYVSTPDATQLDITGDLDLQIKVAMADWTPAAAQVFLGKYHYSVNQRSYVFYVNTNGTLGLNWSTTGSNDITKTSTVATGIADGATKWVRVTLDVDNGASGNDVKFWTSDDGTTWTQLGTTVTTAGVTSVYASTATLYVGTSNAGIDSPANGTFYEAIVKSGIDGFTVFDADFTQVPANALRMTESSSYKAVVTLNTTRYATINRSTSGRKTVAVTQPTWLFGTDDYMEVNNRYMAHSTSAENYVYLSGASGNYMSVSDNPPLDITGDIDIRVNVALDDWTPSTDNLLVGKWSSSNQSYYLAVGATTGILSFRWSPNGTTANTASSTVAPTVTDGSPLWVRVTFDVDNGAGGNTAKFFTSTNGTTWTQLGADVVTAGTTSIFSGTGIVEIGTRLAGTSLPAKGKFYRAQILNGIDGTVVLDADASVITLPSQTTFVDRSSNAYTVTINKSGVGTFVSTGNYLYLPGVAGNYASTPDTAAVSITGDIDIRAKIAMDDWTPATSQTIIGKWSGSSNNSYALNIEPTGGVMKLYWSTTGSNTLTAASTIGNSIVDGTTKWVRATLDVDNGASGYSVQFFTSDDGLTWTQFGSTVTVAGVTSIFDGNNTLQVGEIVNVNSFRGKIFRAQVLNGINGTVAFDANFESSITSLLQTTFTESSTNGATVTINRSGSTFRSAGVIDAGYLYPGATNTFSNSTTNFLDFGASDSFTVVGILRSWSGGTGFRNILSKNSPATTLRPGYSIYTNNDSIITAGVISDPANRTYSNTLTLISGAITNVNLIRNTSADTLTLSTAVPVTDTTTTSLESPTNSFLVGGNNDMEFVAGAIFRTALTATQIRQISNYFANREVYL